MIPISIYFHHRRQFVHAPSKGSSGSAAITTSKLVLTPGGPWPCVKALLRCRHWAFIELKFENERHPQLFSTPNFLISPSWLWYIVMIVVDCCERKGLRHDKVAVSFSHDRVLHLNPTSLNEEAPKLQESTKDPVPQHQLSSTWLLHTNVFLPLLEVVVAFLVASASAAPGWGRKPPILNIWSPVLGKMGKAVYCGSIHVYP